MKPVSLKRASPDSPTRDEGAVTPRAEDAFQSAGSYAPMQDVPMNDAGDTLLAYREEGERMLAQLNEMQFSARESSPETPRSRASTPSTSALPRSRSSIDLGSRAGSFEGTPPVGPMYTPPAKISRRRIDPPSAPGNLQAQRYVGLDSGMVSASGLFRSNSIAGYPPLGLGSHYLKLEPRFEILIDDDFRKPTIYQPTPMGLTLLIKLHQQAHAVDFRVFEKSDATSDTVRARIGEFLQTADLSALSEDHPIGAILTHGQNHAIPVFVARHAGCDWLLIFDSTSGPVAKQFWEVARDFPQFQVRLNAGTRQADNQSCLNDAFEILKQAFSLPDLVAQVDSRKIPHAPGRNTQHSKLKVQRATQPENFALFKLPAHLCFTAQRRKFLEQADIDPDTPVTVDGETRPLSMHLRLATEPARKLFEGDENKVEMMPANIYLYEASRRHRDLIETALREAHDEAC